MNEYQRHVLTEEAFYLARFHDLFKDMSGVLPTTLLNAAKEGNIKMIQDYLDQGSDVSAVYDEEDLLSRACDSGQSNVVELLLKDPNIKLNQCFKGLTPLARASRKGHMECVKLILNAEGKCRPQLENSWTAVVDILKQNQLTQSSTLHILCQAACVGQWDAVHLLLETNYHLPRQHLYITVLHALHQNNWSIVNKVLKRKFSNKDEVLNEIFGIAVQMRYWDRVLEIFQIMNNELKLELPLVQAALDEDAGEVQRLLREKVYDAQTLNGCLLVVAAGGTCDPVAQLLMSVRNTYTHRTFSDALYLASLEKNSELFILLLCNSEASYNFHDFCRARRILENVCKYELESNSLMNFLNKAMESKVKRLLP